MIHLHVLFIPIFGKFLWFCTEQQKVHQQMTLGFLDIAIDHYNTFQLQ